LSGLATLQNDGDWVMRLKVVSLLAAAISLGAAQAASAADMPAKAPIYKAPPVLMYNWTGFYVGINGGGGWGHTDWTYAGLGTTANHNTSGGLIGATLGYNYQIQNWVLGIEGDWDWARINGSATCPTATFTCESKLKSLGTIRGRVGAVWGNALLYATGGWAWANMTVQTNSAATGTVGTSTTPNGWTLGAGVEYAFLPNWSVKVEYLYVRLGTNRYTVDTALPVDAKEQVSILRAGLNYKFFTP
jgi:outer membrane immunogenic protein